MPKKTKAQAQMDEVRAWCRANAPQVKTIQFDEKFNQTFTLSERVDKGPEGYEVKSREFADFDAIKKHYGGKSKSKKSVSGSAKARGRTKAGGGIVKKALARRKSKKG